MDEKDIVVKSIPWIKQFLGIACAIGSFWYIVGMKVAKANTSIAEGNKNFMQLKKDTEERFKIIEDAQYITIKNHKSLQLACQQNISKLLSDEVHELVLSQSVSLHSLDNRMSVLESEFSIKMETIRASIQELKDQRRS